MTLLHTDWTQHSNGSLPSTGDEGTTLTVVKSDTTLTPAISSGCVVGNLDSDPGAIYLNQSIGKKVQRIGAVFGFGAGTTGSSFAMAAWVNGGGVGVVPSGTHVHFTINPFEWTFGVEAEPDVLTLLGGGEFATTLPQDYTPVSAEVSIVGDTATVTLPDGSVSVITDSTIGSITGTIACWEFYQPNASYADSVIYRSWADGGVARPVDQPSEARTAELIAAAMAVPDRWVARWAPSSRSTISLPSGGPAELNSALRTTAIYPASGNLFVEMSAYVSATASSWVGLTLAADSSMTVQLLNQTALGGDSTVPHPANAAFSGTVYASGIITGTPGYSEDLFVGAWCPSGTASVVADNGYGYTAALRVSALPA